MAPSGIDGFWGGGFRVDDETYCVGVEGEPGAMWRPLQLHEARWLLQRWQAEHRDDALGAILAHGRLAGGHGDWDDCLRAIETQALLVLEHARPPLTDMWPHNVIDLKELAPPERTRPRPPPADHFVEVRVLDDAHRPCEGVRCRITLPDGRVFEQDTDEHGGCRIDDIIRTGVCEIELPELSIVAPGRALDAVHELVALTRRIVDLRLYDWQWRALAQVPVRLRTDATHDDRESDGAGEVSFALRSPAPATTGVLEVGSPEHGYRASRAVRLALLEDVEAPLGQRARLDDLGYVGPFDDDDDGPSRWAIEEFQCEHGLPVDGVCGATTRAKLVEIHGH